MRSSTRIIRNLGITGAAVTGCALSAEHREKSRGLSHADLMEEISDIKVERVSQDEARLVNGWLLPGICGGLSITHILLQLSSKAGESGNPFNCREDLKKSYDIQREGKRQNLPGAMYCKLHIESQFESSRSKDMAQIRNIPIGEIKHKLKKKVERTDIDGNSRGIYISAAVHRYPESGIETHGRHALSMTVQKINGMLYCTGMDSNMFFAHGNEKSGCNKIADKMAATLSAYDAEDIQTYTANTAKLKG